MRVEIRPANIRDASYVAAHMRHQDRDEIDAVVPFTEPAQIACMLLVTSPDAAFVAHLGGEPVTVFGVAHNGGHLASAWAFGTKRMRRTIPAVSRYIVNDLIPAMRAKGVRRCDVHTAVGHDLSHGWLAGMGAKFEGVAECYGRNGEDFAVYAWT